MPAQTWSIERPLHHINPVCVLDMGWWQIESKNGKQDTGTLTLLLQHSLGRSTKIDLTFNDWFLIAIAWGLPWAREESENGPGKSQTQTGRRFEADPGESHGFGKWQAAVGWKVEEVRRCLYCTESYRNMGFAIPDPSSQASYLWQWLILNAISEGVEPRILCNAE